MFLMTLATCLTVCLAKKHNNRLCSHFGRLLFVFSYNEMKHFPGLSRVNELFLLMNYFPRLHVKCHNL